jgi:hypothetical protein
MLATLLRRRLNQPSHRGNDRRPARRAFRPRLESLEGRDLPSIVTWINPSSDDWSVGSNWSSGAVPGADDDVVINTPVTVTHSSPQTDTVHSLTESPGAGLELSGGALSFATTFTINGTLLLDGGTLDLLNKDLDGSGTTTNGPTSSWTILGGGLRKTVIHTALDNQGTLEVRGGVDLQGSFSNDAGAALRVVGDGTGTVNFQVLRVANGFTNDGLFEFSTTQPFYYVSLGVTSGTLTNAADGTIHALAGAGGSNQINAELDNEGTLTVDGVLDVSHDGAAHVNGGTINVNGADLNIDGAGASTSVTNTGNIAIAAGRTLSINYNGTVFNQNGGSITGPGTLHLYGATGNFAGDFTTNGLNLYLEGDQASYNSSGTLTVTSDSTLTTLRAPTVNAAVENAGTVVVRGSPRFNGTYASDPGSTLRVLGNQWTFGSNLLMANSFTNHGLIELNREDGVYDAALTITAGNLTNANDGTISVLVGTGGGRTLNANLINDGTVFLAAGTTLTLGGNFTQMADGDLSVEIGGSNSFGQLTVNGSANLDGTLTVTLVNGYHPSSGTTFRILTANPPISGSFATLDGDGPLFTPTYDPGDVTLTAN